MKRLSLIQISSAVSLQRELRGHHVYGIKCLCLPDQDRWVHESNYEANRW